MSSKNRIYNALEKYVFKNTDDIKIHLESAKRGAPAFKGKSGEIKRENLLFTVKNLKHWKDAAALATDPDEPNLSALADLYRHLILDNHVVATIETRVYRVLRSKFVIKSENGEEAPELKRLFERTWFERFVAESIWSLFTGVKVLEIGYLDENLEMVKVKTIPMQNTIPTKSLIVKQVGDTTGFNYLDGGLSDYYIQIGEDQQLGDLINLTPVILAKKLAMGSWLDYIEKFGVPQIWITTDREDKTRFDELFDMAMNMRSNNVAVLRGNEKITTGETSKTDAHNTFKELTSLANSEISKRILGQDGTTDAKDVSGNYGSIKALQEVANDRHESDKVFIENLINKELIPRLLNISSFYSALNGKVFAWDDTEDMGREEFITNVVQLTQAGYILDPEQISEKTGLTILGQGSKQEPEDNKKKS